MLYMLSWRGLGVLAFVAIWVAVGFMVAGYAINEDVGSIAFALGWVVVGVACFIIGRKVNRDGPVHLFCNLKLETWGLIYLSIGLFLGMTTAKNLMTLADLKRPTRPATRHQAD